MKKTLMNNKGNVMIWAPVILIVLLVISTSIFEYVRLNIIAQGTRDAVQAAITQVCTENYDQLYSGLREGYSGGYKLESINWAENVDTGNITAKLDAKLGTRNGEKSKGSTMEYRISDLSVQIKNAPLAPDNPDESGKFSGTATYTLTVPLSFGWQGLPPMKISMTAIAGYSSKGALSGSGGEGSATVPVTGISLDESNMILEKGNFASLAATVSPDDATDPAISWVSSNNAICTVNSAGLVAGINSGTATILAISQGSGIAQCAVSVVTPITGVSLNKANLTLVKGASETLTSTIMPADASNKAVLWGTSDSSICTVDGNGKVTAVKAGSAKIIAASQEGGFSDQCTVTVTIPVTGISLNKSNLTLAKGTNEILTATVYPADATKPDVLWASSNSNVCTVDQTRNISAVDVGTAIVTATSRDGTKVASCTVTVVIPVTGVTLNKSYLTLVNGKSETLVPTIWPGNATNRAVTWTSSNSSIAVVDQTGKVTATGVGSVIIRVTTNDGGFHAETNVTVIPNTYTVTANAVHGRVNGTGIYLIGSTVTLTAIPDEHYHFVNWTNSSGTVIGWGTTYTINGLNVNTNVTANFAIDMFTVTVNASAGGTVTGGGYYAYGSVIAINAIPNNGFHFTNWSDGDPYTSRKYKVIENTTLTAYFRPNAYTWTYQSSTFDASTTVVGVSNSDNYTSRAYFEYEKWHGGTSSIGSSHSTYTFDFPMLLKAGSIIRVISQNIINSPDEQIYINGVSCGTVTDYDLGYSGGDTRTFAYRVPSDISVNTIDFVGSKNTSSKLATPCFSASLFITPLGEKSFLLNNSNTSENQDCTDWYNINAPGKSRDSYHYVSLSGTTMYFRRDTSRYIYVHFINPKAIDHITFKPGYVHYAYNLNVSLYDVNKHQSSITRSRQKPNTEVTIAQADCGAVDINSLLDMNINCVQNNDDTNLSCVIYYKDGTSTTLDYSKSK